MNLISLEKQDNVFTNSTGSEGPKKDSENCNDSTNSTKEGNSFPRCVPISLLRTTMQHRVIQYFFPNYTIFYDLLIHDVPVYFSTYQ